MPVDETKVGWSGYGGYEGPVYYGSKAFSVPENPTFLQKCMAIVAAVEGHVDAVNMYDSGIVSIGTVQWIERGNMSVSDMMGAVAERCGPAAVEVPLSSALKMSNASFRKTASGKWRFFVSKSGKDVEVSTPELQRECFLSCSGKKGEWTPESRLHAKKWCAAFASVWDSPEACQAQLDFSSKRLLGWFVTPNAKKILFSDPSEDGWKGALKAIYVSFAVNVPAIADRNLVAAVAASKFEKWSEGWCLDIIHKLVYGSNITLWLVRYSGLVKRANSLFGVTLPASAKELAMRKWIEMPVVPEPQVVPVVPEPPRPVVPPPVIVPVEVIEKPTPPVIVPKPAPVVNDAKSSNIGIVILALGGFVTLVAQLIDNCR